jgi:hypothetical protein
VTALDREAASIAVMARYLEAVNRLDIDAMVALTHADFEFRAPRRVVQGHPGLRAAMREPRSFRVSFTPQRWFASDERVVCYGVSRFAWAETGEAAGEEPAFARGVVRDARLRLLQVYEDGGRALRDAGLSEADERRPGGDAY